MYCKVRQDEIIEILKKSGYITVKYLTERLHYSTATINRDLNELQKRGLITRSYGGAELVENKYVALPFRYHFMRTEKRKIGQVAASFVKTGDTIFIDASTTTQSMAEPLTEIKDITVISNNMALITYLSEHGTKAICLGGPVFENPCMLFGEETVMNAEIYHADKMFFASGSVSYDGKIGGSAYSPLFRTMAKNSDKIFYLADHKKVNIETHKYLFDFSHIDCVISDYEFPNETKQNFAATDFITV